MREVQRKSAAPDFAPENPKAASDLMMWLARAERVRTQKTHDKNKLYALHAPEVECISKVRRDWCNSGSAGAAGQAAIEEFLAVRGLQLAPEKMLITPICRGFDFLGQNVRKYGNKLLIKPARKSVTSLLNKVREVPGRNKAASQAGDHVAQPDPSGLGDVPPACRGRGDLLTDRSSRVDQAVGVGQTPPPSQAHSLDQGAVLRASRSARLGLRLRKPANGLGLQADAVPAGRAAHQTPHEGSQ